MYFGNQLAVMEYDGRAWRVLKLPLPFTRALAATPAGDIFAGDEEQLGVLARPDSGEPRFTSLLDRVPAGAKPFGTVRDVRAWRGDVFFATDKNLLRYRERENAFRTWPLAGDARNRLFIAGDRLILHRQGEGLHEFANDELRRISDAPELARAGTSFVVGGDAPGQLVLGLANHGLFALAANGALTPWPTEADAILQRTSVLTATRLRDNALAIGTVSEGVILIDPAACCATSRAKPACRTRPSSPSARTARAGSGSGRTTHPRAFSGARPPRSSTTRTAASPMRAPPI
jgi:AraC family chitin signaling transcriptional activator